MNYAETLAYWYLRLNGFFPLSRFVLHPRGPVQHVGDCDLLAIRPRHVYEPVGGEVDDWDASLFEAFECWNAEEDGRGPNKHCAVIVQCKGGNSRDLGEVDQWFRSEHLQYAIDRAGIVSREHAGELARRLEGQTVVDAGDWNIGKLLIIERSPEGRHARPWHEMSVRDATAFIHWRFRHYNFEKHEAWDKFPSDLIQQMIWRHRPERRPRQPRID
jgi:hypothetical protein